MTTIDEVAAMLEATAQLTRAGDLHPLATEREWLARSLIVTLKNILAWHAARDTSALVWCWNCCKLTGRRHKCG